MSDLGSVSKVNKICKLKMMYKKVRFGKSYLCSIKVLMTYKKCGCRCMSERREHIPEKLEVSLWLEQTTTTIRTSQITIIRMRRTHRVLTAQTTAVLTTIRRIARTAQTIITTITTSNRCWIGEGRAWETGPVFSFLFLIFCLTDGYNEYKII